MMVAVGLFLIGTGDCLAKCLSMGCHVLGNGKSWEIEFISGCFEIQQIQQRDLNPRHFLIDQALLHVPQSIF
jgi:hypothetical protein